MISATEARQIQKKSLHKADVEKFLEKISKDVQAAAEKGLPGVKVRLPYVFSQACTDPHRCMLSVAGEYLVEQLQRKGYEVTQESQCEFLQLADVFMTLQIGW